VGGAAAAIVVVAVGAVGIRSGLLGDNQSPVADNTTVATQPPPTGPTQATQTDITPTLRNTKVLSLTSTGNDHQWALGSTTGEGCSDGRCATLFSRSSLDGPWTWLGELPFAVAGHRHAQSNENAVSQLRFVGAATTSYDAYAFGPGLFSAHGITFGTSMTRDIWARAELHGVSGDVTALEARGGSVYALVAQPSGRSALVTSPVDHDSFVRVSTGVALHDAHDLVVSQGVVAFVNGSGPGSQVVSSSASTDTGAATGPWQTSAPCNAGGVVHLSSAGPTLWVLCADGSMATSTISGGAAPVWTPVPRQLGDATGLISARSATEAVVTFETGLVEVDARGFSRDLSALDFRHASMIGFTNDQLGFAVVGGMLWQTTDGGQHWHVEQVARAG
jgi:hypothetical protein